MKITIAGNNELRKYLGPTFQLFNDVKHYLRTKSRVKPICQEGSHELKLVKFKGENSWA